MDNKNMILFTDTNENIDENSVLVMKRRKRKKKHYFKRLLCFILIIGICYFAYENFDKIKVITNNLLDNIQNQQGSDIPPSSDTNIDSDLSNDSNSTDMPDEVIQIPNGALSIIENTGKYTETINETDLTLDFDYSNISYTSAEDIYKQYGNEAPVVLIIHSSCRESYSNGVYYHSDDSFYSSESNASTVGKVICDTLNKNNVNAIHIDQIFANGGIYKSRAEFEKSLNEALKRYPSISYVFDISRDVLINDDLTMNKMVTSINGSNMAQIKIIVGSSTDKNKTFWHKNLSFAENLAKENSDLIYAVTLADFELSQNIAPISMRVDIGAYSNTINDAILAGKELASCLCNLLHKSG